MGPLNLCGAFHLLSSIYGRGCVFLISDLFTGCTSLRASPECSAEGLHGKKKPSLSLPGVNTYRTYFGVESETVSLLSFSQISRSPEIRKLSVKCSPPPYGTHFTLLHICSLLFLFFVCLFLFFVSGTARQEELPLLLPLLLWCWIMF